MYDTTKLFLKYELVGGPVWDCLPYLTNLSEIFNEDTGKTYISGNAGNLRVGVSEHGVNIVGSLAKFYLGTNLHSLNRSDSRRAFEMMADSLNLPIQRATVSRVDIGLNLMTDFKPELYYPYLGQSRYYNRLTQPKSIRYHSEQKTKKFYNKIAESKKSGLDIPEIYKGKNLLRYEVSYMQRLPKQFNQAFITPDTLTDERFYMSMYDRWYNEYAAINKVGLAKMNTSKINTPKDYLEQLLIIAILEKGLDNVLHHVEVMREQKVFKHAAYYSNLKRDLKEMLSGTDTIEHSELIQELNKKVVRAKQHYR
jgi:hypothetical protein